jgi:hypothetical protein
MKTNDFNKPLTSTKLKENFSKQFGSTVNLDQYGREKLEDMRNKLRTKIFQQEGSAKFNDLLTNETYQKNKAMLELLNTRIKEMLGEQMKKLRDTMDALNEGKKAKPDFLDMDKDGNKKEPMKKAVADKKAAPKKGVNPFAKKDSKTKATSSRVTKAPIKSRTSKIKEASHPSDCDCKECSTMESAPSAGLSKAKKTATVKKARAGGDIGKPGKGFEKIAGKAAKKYGSKDKGEKVAAAAMWKNIKREHSENFRQNVRFVNESIGYLLQEDEEGKAKTITAAGDMVNDFTSWMQRVGQYQTKTMIELADAIKADFGAEEAEKFKQTVAPALSATLETLTQQREAVSNAVAILAGEEGTADMMGAEPDQMNSPAGDEFGGDEAGVDNFGADDFGSQDEFGASDAAAGGPKISGRGLRESKEQRRVRKLAEAHSIMSKLSK